MLKQSGFTVSEREIGRTADLALLTLRRGLESYCATYNAMRSRLSLFEPNSGVDEADIIANHGLTYVEAAFDAILHLQHFAEIVIKRVLADEHPLLPVADSGDRHVLLHRLLKRKKVPPAEYEKLRWIEFSTSLERVLALLQEKCISRERYGFIAKAAPALRTLNDCRNRLLHRGRYILRYDALDELVAGYVLPFVLKAVRLPAYKAATYWEPRKLSCGVRPLDRIVRATARGAYDLRKIAFFKAMAHAAYNNPLKYAGFLFPHENERIRNQAEHLSAHDEDHVREVRDCPVCGVNSLMLYENVDSDEDPNTGETLRWWWNIFIVKCACCGFEVNDHLGNPSEYGLNIPRFWDGEIYGDRPSRRK